MTASATARRLSDLLAGVDEVRWSAQKSAAWTRWARERVIDPESGNPLLTEIQAPDAERLIARIAEERGPYLANRVLSLLRVAWKVGRRWGWCAGDPWAEIERRPERPRRRTFDDREAAALEAVRVNLEDAPSYRQRASATACRLILVTGARPSEVLRLRWSEIDWDDQVARLTDSKTGPRELALWDAGVEILSTWRELEREHPSAWVFPSHRGADVPLRGVRRTWDRIRAEAGLLDAHLYDLRRTWGTAVLNGGAPIEAVSKLLGHSDVRVTQKHYAHLARRTAVRAAAEAQGRLAGIGRGGAK